MGILCCTAKYRKLFGLPENLGEPPAATGALGAWYSNPLQIGRYRYLHFMSEQTRLSVLIPLRERRTAEERLIASIGELIRRFGVKEEHVLREVETLSPFVYSRTRSRSVLGSMRDQAELAKVHLQYDDLWEVLLQLADTPCSALSWDSPNRVVPRLLQEHWSEVR